MKLRRIQQYVRPEPAIPWGRLIGAFLAVALGYMAVRNTPQAVRYLRMRQM